MNTTTQDESLEQRQATLLGAFDFDLRRLALRVGKDRAHSSLVRRRQARKSIAAFVACSRRQADVLLSELTPQFIDDYALFLATRLSYQPGTVWLLCQMLKSTVAHACQRGWLAANPFAAFRMGRSSKPREYLTEEELARLATAAMPSEALAFARDLFVFAALTGMSFADINDLQRTHIFSIDGQQWVMARRRKTGVPFQVRLIPAATQIISRHDRGGQRIFGPLSYRTLAAHTTRVMQLCGIAKHVTFHCARHTFAIMALNSDMPIESVSRILGHTNITTTQIYAKITLKKLNRDMDLLENALAPRLARTH